MKFFVLDYFDKSWYGSFTGNFFKTYQFGKEYYYDKNGEYLRRDVPLSKKRKKETCARIISYCHSRKGLSDWQSNFQDFFNDNYLRIQNDIESMLEEESLLEDCLKSSEYTSLKEAMYLNCINVGVEREDGIELCFHCDFIDLEKFTIKYYLS